MDLLVAYFGQHPASGNIANSSNVEIVDLDMTYLPRFHRRKLAKSCEGVKYIIPKKQGGGRDPLEPRLEVRPRVGCFAASATTHI